MMQLDYGRARPRGAHRGSAVQRSTRWWAPGFVAPSVLLVAVLLYLPFLWSVITSFTDSDGSQSDWVGLANYGRLFSDPALLTAIRNTLFWVIGTVVLPVGLGLLIAMLTYNIKGGQYFRLPFLLPYALSGTGTAVVWGFVLMNGGAASSFLEALHAPGADSLWLQSSPLNTIVLILASTWQMIGVNVLIFVVGLQAIPTEPLEAATLDGANAWQRFRLVIWPLLRPLTAVAIGLALVAGLKTFDIVWIVTQGGPGRTSETLAVTMYRDSFVAGDYGYGSAVAVLLTLVTGIASVLYLRQQLSPKRGFDVDGGGK